MRQVVDAQGQVELTRRYDPFGGLESQNGLRLSPYGFAGEEQTEETGHLFLRARTYNPETGRFLQQDATLGDPMQPHSLHRFTYAFNNPVNVTDPSGLMPDLSYNRRSSRSGVAPPQNYRSGYPGGGQGAGGAAPRSVNGPGGQDWQTRSDPYARQKSEGFRPPTCGVLDLVNGFAQAGLNGSLLPELVDLAWQTPKILNPLMTWVEGQVQDLRLMWQTADWRLGASLAYGAIMTGAVAALAATGVGIPLIILAGAGAIAANGLFNAILYDDFDSLGANLAGGGVEMAFGLAGGVIGGPLGWVVGSIIGAGVGQVTSNMVSGDRWDRGLLASMIVSGVADGVGGAIGHGLGSRIKGKPDVDIRPGARPDVPVNRLRSLDDFTGGPRTATQKTAVRERLSNSSNHHQGALSRRLAQKRATAQIDRISPLARWRWHQAGFDVRNPKIQNLIEAGYQPNEVFRLFRGQEAAYPEVLSPAARTGGIEYSQKMLDGELATRLRNEEKAAIAAGVYPPDYDSNLNLILAAHKGNGTPSDSPFLSLSTNERVARRYATDTGVVVEIVIPKDKVININERLGLGRDPHNEAEYVIANHVPDEYIINQSSNRQFPGRPHTVGQFPRNAIDVDEFRKHGPGDIIGRWVDIDDLIPRHPPDTVGLVERYKHLTQAKGFHLGKAIPVMRTENGLFILDGGHHRLETLRQLGYTQAPIVYRANERIWSPEDAEVFLDAAWRGYYGPTWREILSERNKRWP